MFILNDSPYFLSLSKLMQERVKDSGVNFISEDHLRGFVYDLEHYA